VVAVALVGGIVWRHPWHAGGTKASAARAAPHPSASTAGQAASATAPEAALAESPAPSAPSSSIAPITTVPTSTEPSSAPEPAPNPIERVVRSTTASASSSPAPAAMTTAAIVPGAEPAGAGAAASGTAQAAQRPSNDAQTPVNTDLTPGVGRARLRLSFSADSRVDVYDYSGKAIFTGNGRANSVKTIAGIAPFRVYLGFASGVQLQVNDRAVAIGPQFVSGDVARFEAGADGVLRRDTRSAPTNGAPAVAASPRG